MAEKSAKKKRKKADQPGVLGSLPSTRPARLGRARPGSEDGGGTATKTPARATKARATKARSKPAAAKKPRTTSKPRSTTPPASPRRTAPQEPDGRAATPPRGLELVTTGAQAAGELARIGFTVGGQVLKRAARRLPRP
jgi:hypothetical protein